MRNDRLCGSPTEMERAPKNHRNVGWGVFGPSSSGCGCRDSAGPQAFWCCAPAPSISWTSAGPLLQEHNSNIPRVRTASPHGNRVCHLPSRGRQNAEESKRLHNPRRLRGPRWGKRWPEGLGQVTLPGAQRALRGGGGGWPRDEGQGDRTPALSGTPPKKTGSIKAAAHPPPPPGPRLWEKRRSAQWHFPLRGGPLPGVGGWGAGSWVP